MRLDEASYKQVTSKLQASYKQVKNKAGGIDE